MPTTSDSQAGEPLTGTTTRSLRRPGSGAGARLATGGAGTRTTPSTRHSPGPLRFARPRPALLTQTVKRSPINLRPVLRIPRAHNQKAIGLVASAYAHLGATGDATARNAAAGWLDWLERGHLGGRDGMAWGYHFDVQTRFFSYPANTPNTIATTFVARAFLDAVERARRRDPPRRGGSRPRTTSSRRVLVDSTRGPYFGYVPGDDKLIHNCNLLACAMLMDTRPLLRARRSRRDRHPRGGHEPRGATAGRLVAVLRLVGSGLGRQLPHGLRARVAGGLHGGRRRRRRAGCGRRRSGSASCSSRTARRSTRRRSSSRSTGIATPRRSTRGSHSPRSGRPGLAEATNGRAAPDPRHAPPRRLGRLPAPAPRPRQPRSVRALDGSAVLPRARPPRPSSQASAELRCGSGSTSRTRRTWRRSSPSSSDCETRATTSP